MNQPTLIFVRHGNTFEAGQKPVWVGARTDLPLTQEGEQQAQRGIFYITQNFSPVSTILAGPLLRTTKAATIMGAFINKEVQIDQRLCEIDYGKWEGLGNPDIAKTYGSDVLNAWDQNGVWPKDMEWKPDFQTLKASLKEFLDEQHRLLSATTTSRIAVTSNGLLRIFYTLISGKVNPECKVRTGGVCAMVPVGQGWKITAWNVNPV